MGKRSSFIIFLVLFALAGCGGGGGGSAPAIDMTKLQGVWLWSSTSPAGNHDYEAFRFTGTQVATLRWARPAFECSTTFTTTGTRISIAASAGCGFAAIDFNAMILSDTELSVQQGAFLHNYRKTTEAAAIDRVNIGGGPP